MFTRQEILIFHFKARIITKIVKYERRTQFYQYHRLSYRLRHSLFAKCIIYISYMIPYKFFKLIKFFHVDFLDLARYSICTLAQLLHHYLQYIAAFFYLDIVSDTCFLPYIFFACTCYAFTSLR